MIERYKKFWTFSQIHIALSNMAARINVKYEDKNHTLSNTHTQGISHNPYPHAADSFLPWSHSGQVDLVQGLIGQLQVNPLWCYGELECHRLVGLRHRYGNTNEQNIYKGFFYWWKMNCFLEWGQYNSFSTTSFASFLLFFFLPDSLIILDTSLGLWQNVKINFYS